jgi:hypothetical protein
MICAQCAQQVAVGAQRCPTCDGDPPRKRASHHPWTKPIEQPRLDHRHAHLVKPPKLVAPRPSSCRRRTSASKPSDRDVPLMRPEELSRELSQAHHATVALEHQRRTHVVVARALVVLVAAVIAGLVTYLWLALG